jgi:hypothetical protein
MRTRFVNYRPGQVAAAVLVEPMGCFQWWAASMRHRDIDGASSDADLYLYPAAATEMAGARS